MPNKMSPYSFLQFSFIVSGISFILSFFFLFFLKARAKANSGQSILNGLQSSMFDSICFADYGNETGA